jgi:hypothetical protein
MRPAKAAAVPAKDLPILLFENKNAWSKWLEAHHAASPGLWLRKFIDGRQQ